MSARFWETTPLEAMTPEQWESLCDGCAWCCMLRLQDEDTEKVYTTDVACRLLDIETCRCADYERRHAWVPECLAMTHEHAQTCPWLPRTCAYRLIASGEELPDWHPLVSGSPLSVHDAAVSIRQWAVSELSVDPDDLESHVFGDAAGRDGQW